VLAASLDQQQVIIYGILGEMTSYMLKTPWGYCMPVMLSWSHPML
jgi:hypothetical protein